MTACLSAGGSNAVPAQTMYDECVVAYKYMDTITVDAAHADVADDPKVSAAILRIYAGYAASELNHSVEAKALLRQGTEQLVYIAHNSTNADIRKRASTWKSCLIDRDPKCLEGWKENAAKFGSQ